MYFLEGLSEEGEPSPRVGGTFWHWFIYNEAVGESRVAFACLTLVPAPWLSTSILLPPLLLLLLLLLFFADTGIQLLPISNMDWRPMAHQESFSTRLELLRHPASWSERMLRFQLLLCDNTQQWPVQSIVYKTNTFPLSYMVTLFVLFL